MSIDMDQVLQALAENENPEEVFAESLQKETEKTAEELETAATEEQETETPETQEASTEKTVEAVPTDNDIAKVAEADAQGRVIANAFANQLEKLGIAPMADYPADPGALPNNPALEVGRGEPAQPHADKSKKVNAIIGQLVAANKVGAGEITNPAGTAPQAKVDPQEGNMPLAADAAKAQERAAVPGMEYEKGAEVAPEEGATLIVNTLFGKYILGGE